MINIVHRILCTTKLSRMKVTPDFLLYRNLEKNVTPIFITIKLTGQWQVHNVAQSYQRVDIAG